MPSIADKLAKFTGTKKVKKATPKIDKELARQLKLSISKLTMVKKGGGASSRGSHRLTDAMGCGEHHVLRNIEGVIAKGDGKGNFYRDFGTLLHSVLAYYYAEKLEVKPDWFFEQTVHEAMTQDAKGNAKWLKDAYEFKTFFEWWEPSHPWLPISVEEEFVTTVGALDPDGQDEPALDIEYATTCKGCDRDEFLVYGIHGDHPDTKTLSLPALNAEKVTCRPDMIIVVNGYNYIVDHKSAGAARDGSNRLKIYDERFPDYTYERQKLHNLHVVRQFMPIEGFQFQRVKRDQPFDVQRDLVDVNASQYLKMPAEIRESVRRDRLLQIQAVTARDKVVANHAQCAGKYACEHIALCFAFDEEARTRIMDTDYVRLG